MRFGDSFSIIAVSIPLRWCGFGSISLVGTIFATEVGWIEARSSTWGIQMTDIFRFWACVGPTDRVHPSDRDVLSRVNHDFDLRCLPGCFGGRLRTARVVLLYLSPGWSKQDPKEAKSKLARDYAVRRRRGREPFREEGPGVKWLKSRTKCFGIDWKHLRSKMALLNIGAYHSKSFRHPALLAALPSSRISIAWAQEVLFPQAIAGNKVVICLRAAPYWGLKVGEKYGQYLFTPHVTRGGHMKYGKMWEQIVEAVKSVTGQLG
jgi:hypothetical protein